MTQSQKPGWIYDLFDREQSQQRGDVMPEALPDAAAARASRRAFERKYDADFFTLAGDAFSTETVIGWAYRNARRMGYRVDPNFVESSDWFARFSEGIDPEYWPVLREAHSGEHASLIRDQLLTVQERRNRLAAGGMTGATLGIAANLLDPAFIIAEAVAIAATPATGGTSTAAGATLASTKAARLARYARAGLIAGGTEGLLEYYRKTQDPLSDWRDVAISAIGGGVVGPGVEALAGEAIRAYSRRALHQLLVDETGSVAMEDFLAAGLLNKFGNLTDRGKQAFREASPKAREFFARNLSQSLDFDEETLINAGVDPGDPQDIVDFIASERGGRSDVLPPFYDDADPPPASLDFDNVEPAPIDQSAVGFFRWSFAGMLSKSKSPLSRWLSDTLVENVARPIDRPQIFSASEHATMMSRRTATRFFNVAGPAFEEWRGNKANGVNAINRVFKQQAFYEEVGRAVRRGPGEYTADPAVNRVADHLRGEFKSLLSVAKAAGISGFASIPENTSYLPRIFNVSQLDKITRLYGRDAIERIVRAAMVRFGDTSDETLEAIAKGYSQIIQRLDEQDVIRMDRIFDSDRLEILQKLLVDETDLDDSQIEGIVETLRRSGDPEENMMPRAKRRLEIDEAHEGVELLNSETGRLERVRFEDLLENNGAALFLIYERQIHGAAAMQAIYRGANLRFGRKGRSIQDVESLKRAVQETARREGATQRAIEADVNRVEFLAKSVHGYRTEPNTLFRQLLKHVGTYNFVRLNGTFGFAQGIEIGQIASRAGLGAMVRQMPAMRQVFRRAKNGEMSNAFLREIEAAFSPGVDSHIGSPVARFDMQEELGQYGGTVDTVLSATAHFGSKISGFAYVDMLLQRWATASAVQRWADMANSTARMTEGRLFQMGLDVPMAERILRQMQAHVETQEGVFGRSVKAIRLHRWDDVEARSAFVNAIQKWSRVTIQQSDPGSAAMWITNQYARSLFQFRGFMLASWDKQFLRNVRVHDWQTFAEFSATLFTAAMLYTAQKYLASLGRDDAKKYREESLTLDKIAAAAFARSSWSSIIPMIVDTGAMAGGFQQPFQHGRHVGLAGDFIFGNPTLDLLNRIPPAARGVVAPPLRSDYRYSKEDLANQRSLIPFQNAMGFTQMYNAIGRALPERSKRDDE